VDEVGVPDEVVAWFEMGDGHHAAVELEVGVEGRSDLLSVAGEGAVEDAVLGPVEGPGLVVVLFLLGGEEGAEEEVGCREPREGADLD
jgi:hypothetical protein